MTSLVLSAIAAVLFALWVALTLWDRRTQRRLHAAQRESERRWPMLAIEDFTEEDELAPHDETFVLYGELRVYVHRACLKLRRDGGSPCGECAEAFGERQAKR